MLFLTPCESENCQKTKKWIALYNPLEVEQTRYFLRVCHPQGRAVKTSILLLLGCGLNVLDNLFLNSHINIEDVGKGGIQPTAVQAPIPF